MHNLHSSSYTQSDNVHWPLIYFEVFVLNLFILTLTEHFRICSSADWFTSFVRYQILQI